MRFLTAYAALTNRQKILTGTHRMCERPIGILVDALRTIGARLDYQVEDGYSPLAIKGFEEQLSKKVTIMGVVRSKYICELLLLAPTLPEGLEIELTGKIGSRTYIEMTLQLMQQFGVEAVWKDQTITVSPQKYTPTSYAVESDWSGASYWFSLLACADE